MEGVGSPPRFVTISTSTLQIRVKSDSRSPSRSPVRPETGFARSSSARYSRKDDSGAIANKTGNVLHIPRTTGRAGTRSLSPKPDRVSTYSGPPPPSPNSGAKFASGHPFLPTRAPTPPQQLSSSCCSAEDDAGCDSGTGSGCKPVFRSEFQLLEPIEERRAPKPISVVSRVANLSPNRSLSEPGKVRAASRSPNRLDPNQGKFGGRAASGSSPGPSRGRKTETTGDKNRSVSASPNRNASPSPCRLGAVSPSTFATTFSKHVTSPTFLGKYARESNNNNNNSSSIKEPQHRIAKPTFQLTPPCARKFGTATMSAERSDSPDRVRNNSSNNNNNNGNSSIAGTLLSAAATTTAFHLENNNNNNNSFKPMTPPAQRKLGTSSPVPQTLPPNDPRLSYPFCPYKSDTDEARHSSGRIARIISGLGIGFFRLWAYTRLLW